MPRRGPSIKTRPVVLIAMEHNTLCMSEAGGFVVMVAAWNVSQSHLPPMCNVAPNIPGLVSEETWLIVYCETLERLYIITSDLTGSVTLGVFNHLIAV